MNRKYRICRDCGREWNVSRIEPGDKIYICPPCDRVRRLKEREKNEELFRAGTPRTGDRSRPQ